MHSKYVDDEVLDFFIKDDSLLRCEDWTIDQNGKSEAVYRVIKRKK
jgi:hypothetical protein